MRKLHYKVKRIESKEHGELEGMIVPKIDNKGICSTEIYTFDGRILPLKKPDILSEEDFKINDKSLKKEIDSFFENSREMFELQIMSFEMDCFVGII